MKEEKKNDNKYKYNDKTDNKVEIEGVAQDWEGWENGLYRKFAGYGKDDHFNDIETESIKCEDIKQRLIRQEKEEQEKKAKKWESPTEATSTTTEGTSPPIQVAPGKEEGKGKGK